MFNNEEKIIFHISYSINKEKDVIKLQDFIACIESISEGLYEAYKNLDKNDKHFLGNYENCGPVITCFEKGSCIIEIASKVIKMISKNQIVRLIGNFLKSRFNDISIFEIKDNSINIVRSNYNINDNSVIFDNKKYENIINLNININIDIIDKSI